MSRLAWVLVMVAGQVSGQNAGIIQGKVTLSTNGEGIHDAHVLISSTGRVAITDIDGNYRIAGVVPGKYSLVARMNAMTSERLEVEIGAGQTVTANFVLSLKALRQELTVTASGTETLAEDSFQSVTSRDSQELMTRAEGTSLGDLLDKESGIAKRSFGPGSTRPVVRGFDGDRVLMLQDGVRSGTLSYQSGDHGEPIDVNTVERVEVVRGPATLLYGSNAIGGVVNVVTSEHVLHHKPHDGLVGKVAALGGSANSQAQGSGNFSYGAKNWLVQGGGGGTRTGDYKAAVLGSIQNSATWMNNATGGIGRFGERASFNLSYSRAEGQYGIPVSPYAGAHDEPSEEHAEEENDHGHGNTQLAWRRHNARFSGAVKQLGGFLDEFQYYGNYSFWNHDEIELEEGEDPSGRPVETPTVGTRFFNKQWTYQGIFKQRRTGRLSGSFGFWGANRGYEARGVEALAPPVTLNAIAGFALEQIDFERFKLQFGARLENNRYTPTAGLRDRSFTGASASAGIIVPTWTGGSVVANYMHSYRAPALEELYNRGPHPGNNVFEIGNPNLVQERGDGIEVSLRHRSNRVRLETNLFRYQMHDFVYLDPTGDVEDGLQVAEYRQAGARFLGAEAKAEFALHPSLWLLTSFDVVDANLTATRENLPRIPPLRGRLGLDVRRGALSVRPEVVLTNRQWQTSTFETPTAGYAVFGLNGSYTIAKAHTMHIVSVNIFNLGDRLYRNHLSFIKDFAPEIGRGVRIGYSFQWF